MAHPDLPLIRAGAFSAAVVTELLAKAGVGEIRTLGVDGGAAYAPDFSDLEGITKLRTGQVTFDAQFIDIARTLTAHTLMHGPLDMDLPFRVFVGCQPEQDLAFKVLEYSIRRNSSISVRVERLHAALEAAHIDVPVPVDALHRGRTPFSFQRFAIPQLCGYQGRALYLDSDMLVFGDMRELAAYPMGPLQMVSADTKAAWRRPRQFSVMLMDCQSLLWDVREIVSRLDRGEITYDQLMYQMAIVDRWSASLPYHWNSLEEYSPPSTRLVHFTDMDSQPWLNAWHSAGAVWGRYLLDAVADGSIELTEVEDEVAKGNIRPSVIQQIREGEPDPRRLSFSVLRKDVTTFFPVHRRGAPRISRVRHEGYRAKLLLGDLLYARIGGQLARVWRVAVRAILRRR